MLYNRLQETGALTNILSHPPATLSLNVLPQYSDQAVQKANNAEGWKLCPSMEFKKKFFFLLSIEGHKDFLDI